MTRIMSRRQKKRLTDGKRFFRSPIGGYWKDREITRFGEGYEGNLEEKDGKQIFEVF